MSELDEHRIGQLESGFKQVERDLTAAVKQLTIHVAKCEERKERSDKRLKWIITALVAWFGGVEGHDNIIEIFNKLSGG